MTDNIGDDPGLDPFDRDHTYEAGYADGEADAGPQREGLPERAKTFWERVFIDDQLRRARKLLSIHEFHLIYQHADDAARRGRN